MLDHEVERNDLRRSIPAAIVRRVMTPRRSAWAFLILGLGVVALVLLPASVAGCLGPLGVTGIECARNTGIMPTVAIGTPVFAACVLLAGVVGLRGSVPVTGRAIAAIAIGAVITTAAYALLRPPTWSGPTSTGEVITLALPLDLAAVATAGFLGAAAGLVAAWLSRRSAGVRRSRTKTA
jgi:hypothetical protein